VSSFVRVIIPDSHGNHVDIPARNAMLKDIKALGPQEIVGLGDHTDCAGIFSTHQRSYTNEMAESYEEDTAAANELFDLVQEAAPRASYHVLEGNHEQHVERWAARTFTHKKDAEALLEKYGPAAAMGFKRRGFKYYKRSEMYMGIPIPGTIKLGKCYFVHGISHSKHAAAQHLARFGANVVFGHVHRSQSVIERTVTSNGFGAWCPGCITKLQPLYRHTEPTSWAHGYGVQFVAKSGKFIHINVPIMGGVSLLQDVARRLA
jgi:metallophosphoesterase superfamily enzyme